jgi:RNA polymerase sigma factor (sigma-70 family)
MSTASLRPRTQLSLLNDGQLLGRFVARADQAAFAVLVQRHGPLVLGVCRRVLKHDQDTEDAFQAAFVVLARKAATIAKQGSVASWLYKVAYRVALRLRSTRARQQTSPAPSDWPAQDNPFGEVVLRELRQVLDEEVARLPEKYRAPIVLCYLQGQTNEEAAAALACPTGTVKIRLLRGREMLRKRLVRRGVALSVTLALSEALAEMAQAAVPQPLTRAAGEAATGGASAAVANLAGAMLKGMGVAKVKVMALVLVTLALTCLADTLLNRAAAAPTAVLQPKVMPAPSMPSFQINPMVAASQELRR